MRFIRQLLNNVKEAFQSIFRNKGMSLLSVISITAVLVLFGVVALLILNMTGLVNETEKKVDKVVVYLNTNATEEDVQNIVAQAESTGYVRDIEYVSKEEAWKKFSKNMELENDSYFLDGMEENPLPASLTLRISDIKEAKAVSASLQDMPGVYQVDYLNELIGKIVQMNDWVRVVGFVIVGILLVVAIVLIHNTVKSTLSIRSHEIQIMKYIGASNGYIRRPLLLEGLIFGVIAGAIALAVVYFGYDALYGLFNDKLNVLLGMRLIPPKLMIRDMGIIFACIGVGIGLLGSSISLKRYLDV
ncbi:cell division transport system permease protein [Peptoniphilus ivorii]|uniref:permease-like cell division protein FtsX n=1 Tax=Aedoeadaptatus ivorii TaxID=54006 RepID=UPI00278561BA|nr:permease-like cell division protein FtsX [Peptoniphilus ivorii]MDQ0508106.1 cell division transport system permease protein [Peptoniphilus ivorii]